MPSMRRRKRVACALIDEVEMVKITIHGVPRTALFRPMTSSPPAGVRRNVSGTALTSNKGRSGRPLEPTHVSLLVLAA